MQVQTFVVYLTVCCPFEHTREALVLGPGSSPQSLSRGAPSLTPCSCSFAFEIVLNFHTSSAKSEILNCPLLLSTYFASAGG